MLPRRVYRDVGFNSNVAPMGRNVHEHAHVERRDLYPKTRTYALSMLATTLLEPIATALRYDVQTLSEGALDRRLKGIYLVGSLPRETTVCASLPPEVAVG